MVQFSPSALSEPQRKTYDTLIQCAGNLEDASEVLGVTRDTLKKRVQRLGLPLTHFTSQPQVQPDPNPTRSMKMETKDSKKASKKAATATPKKRSRPKKGETPKTDRYERADGDIVVQEGKTRLIKVGADHPAAQAKTLNEELGGTSTPSPSGLNLFDKDGRKYAVVGSIGKAKINFYVQKVDFDDAKQVMGDTKDGEWTYCWPKKKAGCATLKGVPKVSKGLLRNIMKLHAAQAKDRRRKEADAGDAKAAAAA